MADQPVRQVAHKVWISDLTNNEFIHQAGEWDPNYILVHNKKVSRVNIISIVISKYESDNGDYNSITIDDRSDNIQVKAWKDDAKILAKLEVGDILLLIARVREYSGQIYLTPEIVKKLNKSEWLTVRKNELTKEYGKLVKKTEQKSDKEKYEPPEELQIEEEEVVGTPKPTEGNRQKILNIIENLSSSEGADKIEIIKESKLGEMESNKILQELLKEGEIFEIKPGKIKVLG